MTIIVFNYNNYIDESFYYNNNDDSSVDSATTSTSITTTTTIANLRKSVSKMNGPPLREIIEKRIKANNKNNKRF